MCIYIRIHNQISRIMYTQCLQLILDQPKAQVISWRFHQTRTSPGRNLHFNRLRSHVTKSQHIRWNIFPFGPPFSWPWYCGGGVFTSGTGSTCFWSLAKLTNIERVLQFWNDHFQSSREIELPCFGIRVMPSYRAILLNDTLLAERLCQFGKAFPSCIKKGMLTIVVYLE